MTNTYITTFDALNTRKKVGYFMERMEMYMQIHPDATNASNMAPMKITVVKSVENVVKKNLTTTRMNVIWR